MMCLGWSRKANPATMADGTGGRELRRRRSHFLNVIKERKRKWVPARVKAGWFGEIKPPSPGAEEREEYAAAIVAQNHRHVGGGARGEEIADNNKTSLKNDPHTRIREAAAIAIQTAFRGYLARKALRALKGIVRLQAIIRGRAVRRQAINTLRCLQSIVNIQSQLRQTRFDATAQAIDASPQYHNLQHFVHKRNSNCQRRWDDSLLSKQDADVSASSKKEAMMRRERIKEYCSIHRRSDESERNIAKGRWSNWLDQWVDIQLSKSKEVEDLDSIFRSKERQTKVRQSTKQSPNEDMESPTSFRRRKCQHRKQYSMGDDSSFSGSPIVPAYMAATESAKAKARAGSSPKQRQRSFDAYSDSSSPCKNKLACLGSEDPNGHRIGRNQQISPSFKAGTGPVKSARMLKDLSFDSGIFVTSLG